MDRRATLNIAGRIKYARIVLDMQYYKKIGMAHEKYLKAMKLKHDEIN